MIVTGSSQWQGTFREETERSRPLPAPSPTRPTAGRRGFVQRRTETSSLGRLRLLVSPTERGQVLASGL